MPMTQGSFVPIKTHWQTLLCENKNDRYYRKNKAHYAQGLGFKMTNPLNKDIKKFWMVWNPSTGHTNKKHYVLNDAVDEAKRLGLSKLGQKFVVLESICEIVPVQEVKVNMLDGELK